MATARLKVARTSPTLPPSASSASVKTAARKTSTMLAVARAFDRHADVIEGGGDRGVRLVHGNANAGNLRTALKYRLGNGAGRGFDQPVTAGAKRLARGLRHHVVGDGVFQLVGARRDRKIDIKDKIEPERLPDPGFVLHHAVIGVQRQSRDEDPVAHRARLMAAATASACSVGATSCVRMMAAPCSTAIRCAASEPPRRSIGSDG